MLPTWNDLYKPVSKHHFPAFLNDKMMSNRWWNVFFVAIENSVKHIWYRTTFSTKNYKCFLKKSYGFFFSRKLKCKVWNVLIQPTYHNASQKLQIRFPHILILSVNTGLSTGPHLPSTLLPGTLGMESTLFCTTLRGHGASWKLQEIKWMEKHILSLTKFLWHTITAFRIKTFLLRTKI